MGYENIDEAARRQACERVKQIVKAIKALKIRYYLNFSKISEKDQETYQKLQDNLDKISESHNLQNLKVALMAEVDAKYDRKDDDNGIQNEIDPDDNLKACYGAIDAQKEALSRGKITQALRCQEQLKKYKQKLNPDEYQVMLNYKREKFAELMQTREQVEEQTKLWNSRFKGMYKIKHTQERQQTMETISELQNKETIKVAEEETITM